MDFGKESFEEPDCTPGLIGTSRFILALGLILVASRAMIPAVQETAVRNVIGADILNVLLVAGAAATVTEGGLIAPVHFFQILFPAMVFILVVLRVGGNFSKKHLHRPFSHPLSVIRI